MTWPERVSFLILGIGLCTWLYFLTYRVQLILDRAEQAVDNSDRLLGVATWQPEPDGEWRAEHEQRDVPQPVGLDPGIPVRVVTVPEAPDPEPATNPMPVVRTDTVDMDQAWETSAAELVDRTPLVSRTVGGQTFRFREGADRG